MQDACGNILLEKTASNIIALVKRGVVMQVLCNNCETRMVAFLSSTDEKYKYYCPGCRLVYAEDLKEWSVSDCRDCMYFVRVSRQKFVYRDGTIFYGEALYCTCESLLISIVKSGSIEYPRDGRVLIGQMYGGCRGQRHFCLKGAPTPKSVEPVVTPGTGRRKKKKVAEDQAGLF